MAGNSSKPTKTLEEIKAEARAFALSGESHNVRNSKRRYTFQPPPAAAAALQATLDAAFPEGRSNQGHLDRLDEFDDDYAQFVKLLGPDGSGLAGDTSLSDLLLDDDEDEFQLDLDDEDEEEDDDDEQEEDEDAKLPATSPLKMHQNHLDDPVDPFSPLPLGTNNNFYRELQEELNLLEEEDMEAAVATLLAHPGEFTNHDESNEKELATEQAKAHQEPNQAAATAATPVAANKVAATTAAPTVEAGASTPIREAARTSHRVVPTQQQQETLRKLLEQHHQLLLQQAVLAVRSANSHVRRRVVDVPMAVEQSAEFANGGESGGDLVEVLDSAVGMLQDLEQNRKDAIRSEIQWESSKSNKYAIGGSTSGTPNRSLQFSEADSTQPAAAAGGDRRLTRAQFTKTLLEQNNGQARTLFDIQGLSKLNSTFSLIDNSVDGVRKGNQNILLLETVRSLMALRFEALILQMRTSC